MAIKSQNLLPKSAVSLAQSEKFECCCFHFLILIKLNNCRISQNKSEWRTPPSNVLEKVMTPQAVLSTLIMTLSTIAAALIGHRWKACVYFATQSFHDLTPWGQRLLTAPTSQSLRGPSPSLQRNWGSKYSTRKPIPTQLVVNELVKYQWMSFSTFFCLFQSLPSSRSKYRCVPRASNYWIRSTPSFWSNKVSNFKWPRLWER